MPEAAEGLEGLGQDQINNLARWTKALLGNPATRHATLELTKKANPNYTHPELAVQDAIAAATGPLIKQNETLVAEQARLQAMHDRQELRSKLKAKGFDLEIVEKCMTDNHIADYDVACKFMRQEAQLAASSPHAQIASTNANMPDDLKDIAKNPAKWAREKAATILNGFQNGTETAA